jgi:hypothetical protein
MPEVPVGIPAVTLTGRYIRPDGTPLIGSVTFEPPSYLTMPGVDMIAAGGATVQLDSTGAFSVMLIATDSTVTEPTDWSYTVTEKLQQVAGRTFHIQLPSATPTVDLADIAPTDPALGDYVLIPGTKIYTGTGTPASGLGVDGDYYFDTTSGAVKLHGPKASGAWPAGVLLSGSGTSAVTSVNTQTGAVVLTATDVGAATTANITSAVSAHSSATDPHGDRADAATKYLPLAGGTLTGALTGTAFTGSGTSQVSNLRLGSAGSFGGGSGGLLAVPNVTTAPTANPAQGVVSYAEGGVLKVRQSDGNIIPLSMPVRTVTATTATAVAYELLLCDATSNAITVSVPSSPTVGMVVTVKKTDSSANAVTVSATVEGTTNPTLTSQYQVLHIVYSGTAWVRTVRPAMSVIADYPGITDARYLQLAGGTMTGTLTSARSASTDTAYAFGVSGDTFDRARILASGRYEVGPGTAARDTQWYRQTTAMWGTDSDVAIRVAGKGLQVAEGTNAKSGVATMVAGQVTVSTTAVTSNSRIQLTIQTPGGTVGSPYVNARTAGTSFVIKSTSASDTSVVAWFIVEPAP